MTDRRRSARARTLLHGGQSGRVTDVPPGAPTLSAESPPSARLCQIVCTDDDTGFTIVFIHAFVQCLHSHEKK